MDFYIYLTEFFRFVRVYGYCKYGLVLVDGDFDVEAFWIVRIYDDFMYYVVFEGSSGRLCSVMVLFVFRLSYTLLLSSTLLLSETLLFSYTRLPVALS